MNVPVTPAGRVALCGGILGRRALTNLAPFVLLGARRFIMIRQTQSAQQALSLAEQARLLSPQKKVTFKDVAGVDEAKEELKEIIEFLREAQKFAEARRAHSEGRAAGWASWNRQDFAGARRGWRSQRAFLQHLGLRLCGDVRRRWRKPRPRPLRAGQEQRAYSSSSTKSTCGHHRGAGLGGGQRPARADPQRVAGRDGRLRVERWRHPDRGYQPS